MNRMLYHIPGERTYTPIFEDETDEYNNDGDESRTLVKIILLLSTLMKSFIVLWILSI